MNLAGAAYKPVNERITTRLLRIAVAKWGFTIDRPEAPLNWLRAAGRLKRML
jgi:hypothetical protein